MFQVIAPTARNIGASILNRNRHCTSVSRAFASIQLTTDFQDDTTQNTSSQCAHSLLILGKPGGGKGTISGKILADFPQFRHVSTGDQLRQHVRNETPLGKEAKKYMDGEFLTNKLWCRIALSVISHFVNL
jgi:hypothetical protein